VFDDTFGLPSMCGEADVTCDAGMPTLSQTVVGKASSATDRSWALIATADVDLVHALAPAANILLVVAPTSTSPLGIRDLVGADQYVVTNGLADILVQPFGATEQSFSSAALNSMHRVFVSAAQNGVSVLAASGNNGSANPTSGRTKGSPGPTVLFPASDPFVTGVGATILCTGPFATTDRVTDSVDPPAACQANAGQAELGSTTSGGGLSSAFAKPAYQATLPAGSYAIPSTSRGVPDVSIDGNSRTGALVYMTDSGGLACAGGSPCSSGWFSVAQTEEGAAAWAALVALTDQANGGRIGLANPALYGVASDPALYADGFFDITAGNNQTNPLITGYPAGIGWDPVTGLGTPDAARLVPDLLTVIHGS
jgi:subtilase family serine protease